LHGKSVPQVRKFYMLLQRRSSCLKWKCEPRYVWPCKHKHQLDALTASQHPGGGLGEIGTGTSEFHQREGHRIMHPSGVPMRTGATMQSCNHVNSTFVKTNTWRRRALPRGLCVLM
jgi:hypothetical protein